MHSTHTRTRARAVFQEDEIKLIVVGGVLGFGAGMLQVLTI